LGSITVLENAPGSLGLALGSLLGDEVGSRGSSEFDRCSGMGLALRWKEQQVQYRKLASTGIQPDQHWEMHWLRYIVSRIR
jgi:hypothetical protein